MTSWHSYPKVYNLGHRAIAELLRDPVIVEEKIDGSQFSFGIFDGELRAKSKGKEIIIDAPEKMFIQAIETVKSMASRLHEGWTYRGEYLSKPKHNALTYSRVPEGNIIIFDINTAEESYWGYETKATEAARLGLECVPMFDIGDAILTQDVIEDLLAEDSILGGQKIEGVVIKNYNRFGPDGKVLMGKFVSESFKEIHRKDWEVTNPVSKDILQTIILSLKTEARWQKAVQHLKEGGTIVEDDVKNIGAIIKEVQRDVEEECEDYIKDKLYAWAKQNVMRGVAGGVAQWYKEQLLESQFKDD